ncbi:MarR family winged helix-turn-helix transcriptional regulator [Ruixingdingia sedimenti]|uniref:MarR family transcriptional regulator n=1 Tax=Ruixingdingia sedimenti TaxID=3073604 RepID=A0ABU1FCB4_9RHOB|nr:MarR family transcriptional regulator [Xinfangfangia sp. LG-4]MDR5654017.1 MarR family transcriptional regulator [Xinfangfangia sp. LG-4]
MGAAKDRTDDSLIALRRILRATELFERRLAAAGGLTPAQLRVLQVLAPCADTGMTPTAMADRMGISQATVSVLVDRLVARALVGRHRSQTDRRQTHIVITEAGRAAIGAAPDALQQRFVASFERLQDWEQAMLVASLERVAAMLDARDLDASPMLTIGDIARD